MILVLLILGCVVLFGIVLHIRSEILRITANLKKISEEKTNQRLMLPLTLSWLENLAEQINKLLEQKKAAEILFKNMDLQQRQAIANISHDLRTPLTSIIGYMQLLQNGNLSQDEKGLYSEIVLNRAKALQLLITDFYDLSRCEAGEYKLDLKYIRLQDLLCEQIASYYCDFNAKGIKPDISIDEFIPSILADENAVKRIYQNLIQNILKHGSGRVEIKLTYENRTVISRFSNHASGLAKEHVDRMFDRFFTADRVRNGCNTGLGLTIVKAFVESMNGNIKAELKDGILSIIIIWNNIN